MTRCRRADRLPRTAADTQDETVDGVDAKTIAGPEPSRGAPRGYPVSVRLGTLQSRRAVRRTGQGRSPGVEGAGCGPAQERGEGMDEPAIERESMESDLLIAGAGPSGLATLATRDT